LQVPLPQQLAATLRLSPTQKSPLLMDLEMHPNANEGADPETVNYPCSLVPLNDHGIPLSQLQGTEGFFLDQPLAMGA